MACPGAFEDLVIAFILCKSPPSARQSKGTMKGQNHMRILTTLAITLLSTPALLAQAPAAAPSIGQRLAAERPAINHLNETFEFAQVLAKAEALLPEKKLAFDKSTVNATHMSTRNFVDLCQVYFVAFQAADNLGQWEKGLEYLNKALEAAKENVEQGKAPLTEQRDYYTTKAANFKKLIDRNADAIAALKAKTKLEDYEEGPMNQVKAWEKEMAEGEKWGKFFQYDLDMASRCAEDYKKFVDMRDKKIKDQATDIENYKAHPGDKVKFVEGLTANKNYWENYQKAYTDKADRIAMLYRLSVLAPDNNKVKNALDVQLGKAVAEKEAPAKGKK